MRRRLWNCGQTGHRSRDCWGKANGKGKVIDDSKRCDNNHYKGDDHKGETGKGKGINLFDNGAPPVSSEYAPSQTGVGRTSGRSVKAAHSPYSPSNCLAQRASRAELRTRKTESPTRPIWLKLDRCKRPALAAIRVQRACVCVCMQSCFAVCVCVCAEDCVSWSQTLDHRRVMFDGLPANFDEGVHFALCVAGGPPSIIHSPGSGWGVVPL